MHLAFRQWIATHARHTSAAPSPIACVPWTDAEASPPSTGVCSPRIAALVVPGGETAPLEQASDPCLYRRQHFRDIEICDPHVNVQIVGTAEPLHDRHAAAAAAGDAFALGRSPGAHAPPRA